MNGLGNTFVQSQTDNLQQKLQESREREHALIEQQKEILNERAALIAEIEAPHVTVDELQLIAQQQKRYAQIKGENYSCICTALNAQMYCSKDLKQPKGESLLEMMKCVEYAEWQAALYEYHKTEMHIAQCQMLSAEQIEQTKCDISECATELQPCLTAEQEAQVNFVLYC